MNKFYSYKMDTERCMTLVKNHLEANNVPSSHGIRHALMVWFNTSEAISKSYITDPNVIDGLKLAAFTHDCDDHKYFKPGKAKNLIDHPEDVPGDKFPNALNIVNTTLDTYSGDVDNKEVIRFYVNLTLPQIAASNSGNNENKRYPYSLIPRWADRLEAIGHIGIVRCWEYSLEINRPLYDKQTPRCTTEKEVRAAATEERWINYQVLKKSRTMMDHYYDKLLHIIKPFEDGTITNIYLRSLGIERIKPIIDICIKFGINGKLDESDLTEARNESAKVYQEQFYL
jgi:uncharacterized protein